MGPTLVVSLALHVAFLASLLVLRSQLVPEEASAPPAVEVMADIGSEEGEKLPTPSEAAMPTEALPTAPIPPPTPEVQQPPPQPQAQVPPPTPAPPPPPPPPDLSEVAALQPPPPEPKPQPPVEPPPPPIEPPPPTPTPPPVEPPPPPPVAEVPPPPPPEAKPAPVRTPPPSRAKAPAPKAVASKGAPPSSANAADASARANGANRGIDWYGKLNDLAAQRVSYPKEASTYDEGGVVKVHMVIDRSGWIKSVEVVRSSGSDVLDRAAVAVFRDVHLAPFPPGTPDPPTNVEVTLHYNSAHGGG